MIFLLVLFHTLFNEWKVTIARLYNTASIMLHKIFFFFFAFHLMCLEGGVLSSLEEKKKKKTKFEEVAVFLFPLVCVRHQVLGRFPPLVSNSRSRPFSNTSARIFLLFLAMVIHHDSKQWWLWWSSWSCKRFPYISPFFFLLSFPWLCVCCVLY